MKMSISYSDAEVILKAYYEKVFEGATIDFKMESYKKKSWYDDNSYYLKKWKGKLTVFRTIKGLNSSKAIAFEKECSENDLKAALIDALSETFASESLAVSAVFLCEDSIHLFLDKSEVKKLILNRE